MCKFFSFVTKGSKKYYFNWEDRKALLQSNPDSLEPDSHTSICKRFGVNDDKVNKYEYNPLTKKFSVDQTNVKDDQALAKKWVEKLDFKKVVEPLIIKPIVNPLHLTPQLVQPHHIELLKQWITVRASVGASVCASVRDLVGTSVRDLVGASVWASVWDSVGASVWTSVRDLVGASVWASVRDLVGASVWASVRDSVGASVGDSVWASVGAYNSSFFNLEKWKYIDHEPFVNPFQPCIDLWNDGFVPSFDGKTWRLHSGIKADIVWEGVL